jgi:hypothetical protein
MSKRPSTALGPADKAPLGPQSDPRLSLREIAFGLALTGTSGAAILAHTFASVPLSFTAPFVVLPSAVVLGALVLLRRRLYRELHWFTSLLMAGAAWGFGATLVYDAVRPLLMRVLGLTFDPYRAMPIFGQLITGLPPSDPVGLAAGWLYHFWNGISFGMTFALIRPHGGLVEGVVWALVLQALMMLAYPTFLQARLDDPGFLISGLVGHALWGAVLGMGLRHRGARV